MQWARRIGIAALTIVLVVAAGVAWLVGTTSGARWLFHRVAALTQAELGASGFDGTLLGEVTIEGLDYVAADASLRVRAQRASIDLDLMDLLQGTARIEAAEISRLTVSTTKSNKHSSESGHQQVTLPSLPRLPVNVIVQKLTVQNATVRRDGNQLLDVQTLQLTGRWTDRGIVLEALDMQAEQGTVELAGELRCLGNCNAVDARGKFRWQVRERSIAGSLQVDTDEDVVNLAMQLSAPTQAELRASIALRDGNPWSFDLDLSHFDPELPGIAAIDSLAASLRGSGTRAGGSISGRVVIDGYHARLHPLKLSGNLQQFSIDGELSVGPPERRAHMKVGATGSPQHISISELRILQPSGYFVATGEVTRQPDLHWNLQAHASNFNPGALLSRWPGNLDFELDTQGGLTDAGPYGMLELRELRGQLRSHSLTGSADLTLTTEPALSGRLNLQSGASRIQVVAERGEAWDATVRFDIAALENWLPRSSGSLSGRFDVEGEWPEVKVGGSATAKRLQVAGLSIDVAQLSVDAKNPRAPSGFAQLVLEGAAVGPTVVDAATARISGDSQQHTLSLQAQGSPGSVRLTVDGSYAERRGEARWLETIRQLSLDLRDMQPLTLTEPASVVISDARVDLSRTCVANSDGRLCAAVDIERGGVADARRIDGTVTATIPDIAAFALISPNLANVHGRAELSGEVDGTLGDPHVRVALEAAQLTAEIPRLGLHLNEGVLNAESLDDNRVAVSGSIRSGDGRLSVTGTVTTGGAANLQIEGEQFLAADIPGARVIADADLRFVRGPDEMLLTGRVTVASAQVGLQELRRINRVETGTSDVVIVDAKARAESAAEGIPLRTDITVVLGEEITVSGFGLEAQLDGQLAISEVPGQPTTATGEVRAEGTYRAFGQELTISQGSILYADMPLDNPRLNIVATREIEDITAGVRIVGPAQRPELTVFSDPAMDEANALSYLLAGRPLQDIGISETDADMLTSAAESLGAAAGGLLAKRIGDRLGIDLVALEQNEFLGSQVFTVGEYLSPRLYLSYGVGLFEPGDVITLRYRVSDRVAVRAIRGPEESRVGIEYQVER